MKYLLGFVLWLATMSGALADGSLNGKAVPKWSTVSAGGGQVAFVRTGKNIPTSEAGSADYRLCNTTPKVGDGTNQKVGVTMKGREQSIAPGTCTACTKVPPDGVLWSQPGDIELFGTYQAFKVKTNCQATMKLGRDLPPPEPCEKVVRADGRAVGSFADWVCNLMAGPKKQRNVRLCADGTGSIANQDQADFNNNNYLIVDKGLTRENILGPTGQPRIEFSHFPSGCIDFYAIDELRLLIVDNEQNDRRATRVHLKNIRVTTLKK